MSVPVLSSVLYHEDCNISDGYFSDNSSHQRWLFCANYLLYVRTLWCIFQLFERILVHQNGQEGSSQIYRQGIVFKYRKRLEKISRLC
jgi:hypothetical protein